MSLTCPSTRTSPAMMSARAALRLGASPRDRPSSSRRMRAPRATAGRLGRSCAGTGTAARHETARPSRRWPRESSPRRAATARASPGRRRRRAGRRARSGRHSPSADMNSRMAEPNPPASALSSTVTTHGCADTRCPHGLAVQRMHPPDPRHRRFDAPLRQKVRGRLSPESGRTGRQQQHVARPRAPRPPTGPPAA